MKGLFSRIGATYQLTIYKESYGQTSNPLTQYRLAEKHLVGKATEPAANYDLLSVIMLCLGGRGRATYSGVIRLLDVLLSSDIAETEKRYILESNYNIPMTEAIESEMSMTCNLSEGVWERGMTEGVAKGLAEGRAKGKTEGVVTSIKNIMETLI